MSIHIALFRAINVGGKNVLPMKELRALLERIGCQSVSSYIQSGNVVFESTVADAAELSHRIRTAVEAQHGFRPEVLLLSLEELASAVASNPFPEAEADPGTLHVSFLATAPDPGASRALDALRDNGERFALQGRVFYLHAPAGIGRSRLAANAERLLGVPMTTRNWRSVCRILAIAREGPSREGL